MTGASRGIGAAIAVALSDSGADVALLARSSDELDRMAGRLRSRGRTALPITCDVTDSDAVDDACDRILEEMGPIDILINTPVDRCSTHRRSRCGMTGGSERLTSTSPACSSSPEISAGA